MKGGTLLKESKHEIVYRETGHEMAVLLRRIEELEAEHAQLKSKMHGKRFFRARSWTWLRITVGVLLAFGLLGAQSKQDALYINEKGNVGINQTNPTATLEVNGTALVNGDSTIKGDLRAGKNLDVAGTGVVRGQLQATNNIPGLPGGTPIPANSGVVVGNSDIYFTNTEHGHTGQGNAQGFAAIENDGKTYKALMILGRQTSDGRIVRMWDRVGIGSKYPLVPLDVRGEIRGMPWVSQEYEWQQGKPAVPMTKIDHSVCFLTLVSGKYMGRGEAVYIEAQDGKWVLTGFSQQQDVRAKARCIGAPDNSW